MARRFESSICEEDGLWNATLVGRKRRRVDIVLSKSGFAHEEEALAWIRKTLEEREELLYASMNLPPVETNESFGCPFCQVKLQWSSAPAGCAQCGAVFESGVDELLRRVRLNDAFSEDALHALGRPGDFFRSDSKNWLCWGRPLPGCAALSPDPFTGVVGPDHGPGTVELPIIIDCDLVDPDTLEAARRAEDAATLLDMTRGCEENPLSLPRCRFCVHSLAFVPDQVRASGAFERIHNDKSHFCVYPLHGTDIVQAHPAAFACETREWDGRRSDEDTFRDALHFHVTAALVDMDRREVGPTWTSALTDDMGGALCARFEPDEAHEDMDGGPYEVLRVRIAVRFDERG